MATAQQLYAFDSHKGVHSYSPKLLGPLSVEIEEWVVSQVEELGPAYIEAGVPLTARIEKSGRTLRVVSGSDMGPCTLAEMVLKGWEEGKMRLELTINAHGGLSMDPSYLESVARRAAFVGNRLY